MDDGGFSRFLAKQEAVRAKSVVQMFRVFPCENDTMHHDIVDNTSRVGHPHSAASTVVDRATKQLYFTLQCQTQFCSNCYTANPR